MLLDTIVSEQSHIQLLNRRTRNIQNSSNRICTHSVSRTQLTRFLSSLYNTTNYSIKTKQSLLLHLTQLQVLK